MAKAETVELTEEDLSAAIEGTEQEIFTEITGADEPDNSGDKSLEQMSETFDESDLDEEAEDEPTEDEEGEAEPEEGADEQDEVAEPEPVEAQDRRGIPSHRLREESERRRAAETELSQLREQMARQQGQIDMLSRQQPQPQRPEPPAKPDMFADPEGYERWMLGQAEARANAKVEAIQERMVNASMARAHQEHGQAFATAYDTLKNLDPRNPANVATVRSVIDAPDPGAALMDWHEKQQILADPQAYRESLKQELLAELRGGTRSQRGQQQQRGRIPPSLNGASGTGATRANFDPRGLDGSERSIMDYVFDPSAG